jgi:hypothetical protein
MNSKERDLKYGKKSRNIEQKIEALPQPPARKPYPGYCKRLKGAHVFTLFAVRVYPYYRFPHGYHGPAFVYKLSHHKEYRCDGCGKKKTIFEYSTLDELVPAEKFVHHV